jgi:hypothetical protein
VDRRLGGPGLDDVEKRKFLTLAGLELRPLRHPACSQSLYRLRYVYFMKVNEFSDFLELKLRLRSLQMENIARQIANGNASSINIRIA